MDNSFTDDPFFSGSYPEPGQIDPPNRSLECDAFLPSLGPNSATRIPDRDSTALSAPSPASHHARHGSVNQQPLEQWQANPGVRPAVRGSPTDLPVFQNSREAYPILVPGQAAEQVTRYKQNMKCLHWPVRQSQNEMAEAGFIISDDKSYFSCQYCSYPLTFDALRCDSDLWTFHFEECNHLHMHHVEQRKKQQAGISALSAPNQPETQASEASCDSQQPLGSMTDYSVLSLEKQRKYPSDKELAQLSRNIGKEFMQLGLELDLPFCRVQQIEIEYSTVSNRCLAILTEWRSAQAGRATLGDLEKVFRKLNIDTMVFNQL